MGFNSGFKGLIGLRVSTGIYRRILPNKSLTIIHSRRLSVRRRKSRQSGPKRKSKQNCASRDVSIPWRRAEYRWSARFPIYATVQARRKLNTSLDLLLQVRIAMLWKQHMKQQSYDFCHEDNDWWWSVVMFRFAQLFGYHPRLIVNLAFSFRPDTVTAFITLLHICTHLDPLKTTRLVDGAQAGNNSHKKKRTAQMVKSHLLTFKNRASYI